MITLRLNPKLEQQIVLTAKNFGISKSQLVRKSLQNYLQQIHPPTPWEVGKELFGKYASGQANLSAKRKELIKEKIRAKRG